MPEQFWDAKAGKLSDEGKFGEWVNGNAAAVAAENSRRLTLPQKPDDYKIGTTANFKPPEGLAFQIDEKDPLWSQGRAWAHKHGLSQEAFAEAIDLVAGRDIGNAQSVKAAYDAEVGKLGASGPARIDAVTQWLNAVAGPDAKALTDVLKIAPVASTVTALENLMKTFTSQGVTSFNRAHGTTPPADKIPGFDGMSYEQRRFAQDQLRARQAAGR